MSTALVEAWQGRSGATLTAAAYHAPAGCPVRWPDWRRRPSPGSTNRHRRRRDVILLRLAETGEGGVLVRRRVPRRELGDDPATAQA
jgi:hypothetical protein